MKYLAAILFIYFFVLVGGTSCDKHDQKDQLSKSTKYLYTNDIIGKWINISNGNDTLIINDSIISRNDLLTGKREHSYSYMLISDSIKLIYTGTYYIYVPEKSFKIGLNEKEQLLTIYGIDKYFPQYVGTQFKKSK
jgi:hypothetical protein